MNRNLCTPTQFNLEAQQYMDIFYTLDFHIDPAPDIEALVALFDSNNL